MKSLGVGNELLKELEYNFNKERNHPSLFGKNVASSMPHSPNLSSKRLAPIHGNQFDNNFNTLIANKKNK